MKTKLLTALILGCLLTAAFLAFRHVSGIDRGRTVATKPPAVADATSVLALNTDETPRYHKLPSGPPVISFTRPLTVDSSAYYMGISYSATEAIYRKASGPITIYTPGKPAPIRQKGAYWIVLFSPMPNGRIDAYHPKHFFLIMVGKGAADKAPAQSPSRA